MSIEVYDSQTMGRAVIIQVGRDFDTYDVKGDFTAVLGTDFKIECRPDPDDFPLVYVTPEYYDRLHFSFVKLLPKFEQKSSGLTEF